MMNDFGSTLERRRLPAAALLRCQPDGPRDAVDFARIHRVLVVALLGEADTLLAAPVFATLKHQYPHLEIDALVYRGSRDMLSLHPSVGHLFTLEGEEAPNPLYRLDAERELVRDLDARQYDLLIHLNDHWRGALLKRLLGIPLAVCADSARLDRNPVWRGSFTHRYPRAGSPRHPVERHLDALRRLGVQPAPEDKRLHLEPGPAASVATRRRLLQRGLGLGDYVLLHPGGPECWEEGKTAALIDRLEDEGHRVLVTAWADAGELARVRQILSRCRRTPVSLAGELTAKELAYCIGHARLFVGVDSLPMHMAAALATPSVALPGPGARAPEPWPSGGRAADWAADIAVEAVFDACRESLAPRLAACRA